MSFSRQHNNVVHKMGSQEHMENGNDRGTTIATMFSTNFCLPRSNGSSPEKIASVLRQKNVRVLSALGYRKSVNLRKHNWFWPITSCVVSPYGSPEHIKHATQDGGYLPSTTILRTRFSCVPSLFIPELYPVGTGLRTVSMKMRKVIKQHHQGWCCYTIPHLHRI
jgi:hypothetical protein